MVELKRWVPEYLNECELRFLSPHTINTRRVFLGNLFWFLEKRRYTTCGTWELRQFFHYLMHGHEEPGGRFGHRNLNRPVRPITLKDYDVCLRMLFDWLKRVGAIAETPFVHIPKPRAHTSLKEPLSPEQIASLLHAAQRTSQAKRNIAILSFLLDTGCRASELIAIALGDLDLTNRSCTVLGKGNKYRTVYFGNRTADALQEYLFETYELRSTLQTAPEQRVEQTPLFLSNRCGEGNPEGLTRSGLLQLIERLGKRCGIKASCSPHALRRAFAVQTLRNGANVFSVQAMLGHSDLGMTRKYCALALADVEAQHRQFGPLDRLALST